MLHRFKTFESYFETHVDPIKNAEKIEDFFNRYKHAAQREIHQLAYDSLEQTIASECHELGYEMRTLKEGIYNNLIEIINNKNQLFRIDLKGVRKGSDYFVEVMICLLRSKDLQENENLQEDIPFEIPYKVNTVKDVFDYIKKFKSVVLETESGKTYFLAEHIFKKLDESIDSNAETHHHTLHTISLKIEKLFRNLYGVLLSGKNDFEYRGRKYRYTGMALYELTKIEKSA